MGLPVHPCLLKRFECPAMRLPRARAAFAGAWCRSHAIKVGSRLGSKVASPPLPASFVRAPSHEVKPGDLNVWRFDQTRMAYRLYSSTCRYQSKGLQPCDGLYLYLCLCLYLHLHLHLSLTCIVSVDMFIAIFYLYLLLHAHLCLYLFNVSVFIIVFSQHLSPPLSLSPQLSLSWISF